MTTSNERIRELLKHLRHELDTTEVDPQTLADMRELDNDIHSLLNSSEHPAGGLLERAKAVEVQFAAKHQVAERILREIVDTLARLGI